MLARLLSALLLIPVVLAVIYVGDRAPWGTSALLLLLLTATVLGCYEFAAIFRSAGRRPSFALMTAIALAAVLTSYLRHDQLPAVFVFGVAAVLVHAISRDRAPSELVADAALTVLGAYYVGGLLSYGILLRGLPQGFQWTLAALLGTWAADSGAYFAGRLWGRTKFLSRVSPGKTWEGFFGGLILALLVGIVVSLLLVHMAPLLGLVLGLVVFAAAVVGDLAESLLKRGAGVKDSGTLIPGHGGVLDRVDSLLFVLPAVYYFAIVARS